MIRAGLLIVGLTLAAGLGAQDQPPPPNPARGERNGGARPGEDLRRHVKQAVDRKLAELQQTDPKRYAELVKLREENPAEFMREMRQLFGADGEGAGEAGAPGAGRFDDRLLKEWEKRNPDEFKRFKKLRDEDPEQAREMLRNLFAGFRRQHFGADDESRRLAQACRQATDPQAKEKLKADLKRAVEASFDDRLAAQQKDIDALAARLAELKTKLEQFKEQRDAICAKRLEQLLEVPPENLDPPPPPRRKPHGKPGAPGAAADRP